MTPVSSDYPTVSQRLASARMTLSNVTEFLTLPSSTSVKMGKPFGRARSKESLAIMLEKKQKKKEEEEAKERRKLKCVENKE